MRFLRDIHYFVLMKRCPFCNSPKRDIREDETYYDGKETGYYVRCGKRSCGAVGPQRKTYRQAVLAWNKNCRVTAK